MSDESQIHSHKIHFHRTSVKEAATLVLLSGGVGLASGISAVVLNLSVHNAIHWLKGLHQTYWFIIIPAVGALLSSLYLKNVLKDTAKHGVPELIRSTTVGGGFLRTNMIYSRLVSSFLTVSTGGSAGLEGPIATSGGAIGSFIARLLKFSERRRILLVGYGVAGAISAIFNAPLTGTVFTLEVILGEWSAMTILPTIISAVSATQFSRLVLGNQIAFPHEIFAFNTQDLFSCVLLGFATGLLSVAFVRGLNYSEINFSRIPIPTWLRAAFGGFLVGITGYFMPSVLHDGYEAIQGFLKGVAGFSLYWIALFIVLKFCACCFTLGSGGSGGVFAPSLVLGSATGYGFGEILHLIFPNTLLASSSAYGLVGMSGMVTGLMHAPFSGMFLVLEITGGYRLILPVMITSVTAMLVSYYFDLGSIYTRELIFEGSLHRKGSDTHLLQKFAIKELLDEEISTIYEDMLLKDFLSVFKNAKRNIFPVLERDTGRWLGVVYLDDIRSVLFEKNLYPILAMGELMHSNLPAIETTESAVLAIEKFEQSHAWALPVVENGKFLGMISKSTLFDHYRHELIVHTEEG